jgi:hypothetical protein
VEIGGDGCRKRMQLLVGIRGVEGQTSSFYVSSICSPTLVRFGRYDSWLPVWQREDGSSHYGSPKKCFFTSCPIGGGGGLSIRHCLPLELLQVERSRIASTSEYNCRFDT